MSEGFTQWLQHLAEGDTDASEQVWNDYFSKLVRLAKRKIEGLPHRDFDEEDVALSAMQSFYQGLIKHQFDGLRNRTDLWKLLVTITARKVSAKRRSYFAVKRGSGRVRGESIFGPARDENDGLAQILGTEPTPELAVSVAENCRCLLDQLPDETFRKIAIWTLEGYRTEEIADKLGCVRRTIERKLERIREIWGKEL